MKAIIIILTLLLAVSGVNGYEYRIIYEDYLGNEVLFDFGFYNITMGYQDIHFIRYTYVSATSNYDKYNPNHYKYKGWIYIFKAGEDY